MEKKVLTNIPITTKYGFRPKEAAFALGSEKLLEECVIDADVADEPIDLGAQRILGFFLKEVRDSGLRHRQAPPVKLVATSLQYPSSEHTCQRGPRAPPR